MVIGTIIVILMTKKVAVDSKEKTNTQARLLIV